MSKRRVAEILARYPGPVTLQEGRWGQIFFLVICCGATIAGILMIIFDNLLEGVGLVAFSLLSMKIVVPRVRHRGELILDADEFVIDSAEQSGHYPWHGVDNFRMRNDGGGKVVRTSCVFDLTNEPKKRSSDYDVQFPDFYGLSRENLPSLMTQWRALACKINP
jgi:hypothetical protein